MENPGVVNANHLLVAASIILIAGILSSKIAGWFKTPDVVVLLLIGILIGPPGLNWISLPVEGTVKVLSQILFAVKKLPESIFPYAAKE